MKALDNVAKQLQKNQLVYLENDRFFVVIGNPMNDLVSKWSKFMWFSHSGRQYTSIVIDKTSFNLSVQTSDKKQPVSLNSVTNELVQLMKRGFINDLLKGASIAAKYTIAAAYELIFESPIDLESEALNRSKEQWKKGAKIYKSLLEEDGPDEDAWRLFLLNILLIQTLEHLIPSEKVISIPTDPASAGLTLFSLENRQREVKNTFKVEKVTIRFGTEKHTLSPSELETFISSLPKRVGDVYNYIIFKAYSEGYSHPGGKGKAIRVKASDIAAALSKDGRPSKRLTRQVAEILGEYLPKITLEFPLDVLPKDVRKKLQIDSNAKNIAFSPFIFLVGLSEGGRSKRLRLYSAEIVVNPILWALYSDLDFKTPIPSSVLKLNPQYTTERWAKMISYKLHYHARVNRNNTKEHRIKIRTLLKSTGILNEIEKMQARKHHQRATEYLRTALKLAFEASGMEIVDTSPPKALEEWSSLDELLNTTLTYKMKSLPHRQLRDT